MLDLSCLVFRCHVSFLFVRVSFCFVFCLFPLFRVFPFHLLLFLICAILRVFMPPHRRFTSLSVVCHLHQPLSDAFLRPSFHLSPPSHHPTFFPCSSHCLPSPLLSSILPPFLLPPSLFFPPSSPHSHTHNNDNSRRWVHSDTVCPCIPSAERAGSRRRSRSASGNSDECGRRAPGNRDGPLRCLATTTLARAGVRKVEVGQRHTSQRGQKMGRDHEMVGVPTGQTTANPSPTSSYFLQSERAGLHLTNIWALDMRRFGRHPWWIQFLVLDLPTLDPSSNEDFLLVASLDSMKCILLMTCLSRAGKVISRRWSDPFFDGCKS